LKIGVVEGGAGHGDDEGDMSGQGGMTMDVGVYRCDIVIVGD
jgi:hypothetical protein